MSLDRYLVPRTCVLVALLFSGCGHSGSSSSQAAASGSTTAASRVPKRSPVIASITVTPSTAQTTAGSSIAFSAQATDTNGTVISGVVFTWTATGGTVSSSGVYTAGSTPGSYRVEAINGVILGSASVTVNGTSPPPPPPPAPPPSPPPPPPPPPAPST